MLYRNPPPHTSMYSPPTLPPPAPILPPPAPILPPPAACHGVSAIEYTVRTVVLTDEPVEEKAAKSCSPSKRSAQARRRAGSGACPTRAAYRSSSGCSRREK